MLFDSLLYHIHSPTKMYSLQYYSLVYFVLYDDSARTLTTVKTVMGDALFPNSSAIYTADQLDKIALLHFHFHFRVNFKPS